MTLSSPGRPFAEALARVDLVTAIHHREVMDSTSTFLLGLIPTDGAGMAGLHGVLAIADRQTVGRGRLGRRWEAPPGEGLLFSLLLDGNRISSPGLLPAAAGVAVVRAIRRLVPSLHPRLKWPNDVLIRERKVCGILAERSGPGIVLGVGINVAQQLEGLPEGVAATSLALELGEDDPLPGRPEILAAFLQELQPLLDSDHGTERTLEAFSACHDTLGRRVRVTSSHPGRPVVEGLALAVDTDGALIVRLDHGPTVAVHSGEATLQGSPDQASPPRPPGS